MDKLQEIMADYESLTGKKYYYELVDNCNLEVVFNIENFPHLVGLHKLTNIKDLDRLNKKTISGKKIYKYLSNRKITSEMIFSSPYYCNIENKFIYFFKIKELVFEKVIYDFDRSKLRSKINADLVLYTIQDNLYIHLFLVRNSKGYYSPMTFIVEIDDRYIKGQTEYEIKKLSVLEDGKSNVEYIYDAEFVVAQEEIAVSEDN